jgi:periplasmic protein TonB
MKKIIFAIVTLFYCTIDLKAQSNAATKEEIKAAEDGMFFTKTEQMADFKGGEKALAKYLKKNLNMDLPKKNGAPVGNYTVVVRFIVYMSGKISNIIAETKYGYGMEDEAIRIISESPDWSPAIQNGNIVVAYKRQAITFLVK